MTEILGLLFPPKLGRIENHGPSVTLYLVRTGEVKVIEAEPWSWAGNTRIWHDGQWHRAEGVEWKASKPERNTYLTTLS